MNDYLMDDVMDNAANVLKEAQNYIRSKEEYQVFLAEDPADALGECYWYNQGHYEYNYDYDL